MVRKGYNAEYRAKKELIKLHGRQNVVKVAIGGAQDFIILEKGRAILVVEVKETKNKKYYPTTRDKKQFARINDFCKEHSCHAEVWVWAAKKWLSKKEMPRGDAKAGEQ